MNLYTVKSPKPPRLLLDGLFAFSPNREILGGTAYFIVEKSGNILIDCPPYCDDYLRFIGEQGGVRWLFLTHRGGMSASLKSWQTALECDIIIQEQEAYLLPTLSVTSFEKEMIISETLTAIWTPGHSTGSACLYWQQQGGVLFTGRHLLPDQQGNPVPLKLEKTFHWGRQLQSVAQLCDRFSSETLRYICPGANTGFLRGKGLIDNAFQRLIQNQT
ncbi:MBL fold metallo-hydrolase [Crocosphaera sp.]|uniref:MBL fold metallo-hydrolase n=1 Tax=Crocosphaera sp. TaxID=2729996 RepID=UPI003F287143|nr:MBL fold metallo-hydrolase [Crocosphaera sp.]